MFRPARETPIFTRTDVKRFLLLKYRITGIIRDFLESRCAATVCGFSIVAISTPPRVPCRAAGRLARRGPPRGMFRGIVKRRGPQIFIGTPPRKTGRRAPLTRIDNQLTYSSLAKFGFNLAIGAEND